MATSARRLAAVVFTDIVGYSAIVHRDEALGAQLLDRQRAVVRRVLPQQGGREVETAGDSFLLEFESALSAVQAVIAIQQALAADPTQPPVTLRASVHLGDVEHRGRELFGDGVNIAARLLPHSPEGGLALSAPVLALVRQRMTLPVRCIGTPALKNIADPVEIFVVDAAALAGLEASTPMTRAGWRPRVTPATAAMVAGALALVLVVAWWAGRTPGRTVEAKSVAVLPFANLSEDKANGYFSDGMQDAIITNLAHVRDLKVISRTSVMEFRDTALNLRDVAQRLGVAHIVEGSVQKAGTQVRVNVQLIEAATDRHIWAETYDRELADVFAIQSDLAEKVATSIRASLTPEEKQRIERRPTENVEAYDLYLRGRELEAKSSESPKMWRDTLALFERATALDPSFAQALAATSRTHSRVYWFDYDRTPERLAQAKAAADAAERVGPGLPEVELAFGYYRYWGFRDYPGAQRHFRRIFEVQPGNAEALYAVGLIERRLGRWPQAIDYLERALALDPLDGGKHTVLGETLFDMRDYAACARAYRRQLGLLPEFTDANVDLVLLDVVWKGDTAGLPALIPTFNPGDDADAYIIYQTRVWLRQYAEAAAVLENSPIEWLTVRSHMLGTNNRHPRVLLLADAHRLQRHEAKARAGYEDARRVVEAELARSPDDARVVASHALALAGLGLKHEAVTEAKRAVSMMPVSRDALVGPQMLETLAAVHATGGEPDQAIDLLEQLLGMAGRVSVPLLRVDPRWDPLRTHPRFQKLVAGKAS